MTLLETYIAAYGFLAVTHAIIQMFFGHLEYKKQTSKRFDNFYKDFAPTVAIVVPSYNEDPIFLEACLQSILKQDYKSKISVYIVDDGSTNMHQLKPLYNKYSDEGFNIIYNKKNLGKRESHKRAFDIATEEVIVTIDSDTVLEAPNGIKKLVRQLKNPEVAAVTGEIKVANKKENFFTSLISYRYWNAFNQERAAQSYFKVLLCCSGPFSAYRKSVIDEVKEEYVNQKFLGNKCTYGDDRHLTNLMLDKGYRTVSEMTARCFTYVPNNLRKFVIQQIRWNKSFYREMLWTLNFTHKHHFYMLFDLLSQIILKLLLLLAIGHVIYRTVLFGDVTILFKYVLFLIGVAVIRSIYGILRTKDLGFLTFVAYGFIYIFVLLPVSLYSLSTIREMKWGTR